jgi:hypothetical protein
MERTAASSTGLRFAIVADGLAVPGWAARCLDQLGAVAFAVAPSGRKFIPPCRGGGHPLLAGNPPRRICLRSVGRRHGPAERPRFHPSFQPPCLSRRDLRCRASRSLDLQPQRGRAAWALPRLRGDNARRRGQQRRLATARRRGFDRRSSSGLPADEEELSRQRGGAANGQRRLVRSAMPADQSWTAARGGSFCGP